MLIQWGFAKKAGAWINLDSKLVDEISKETGLAVPNTIQGMEKLRTFLEENKEICLYLFNKFKGALAK